MKSVTATGNTIDEAIASGLAQLHIEEKQAQITVVEEGKKGFFGLFGHKPFIVKVEKKERLAELVVDYLHGIMKELGVDGTTHIEETPGNMLISLTTNESKGFLAKNGQALYAVEQLLQTKINHHSEKFMTCEFDVNRWKENRRKKVEELARSSADKALELNRKVYLDPLPPLERKWVHHALTGRDDIETTSEGKDPRRFVIIKPTSLNP